jgi:hypothetical protein
MANSNFIVQNGLTVGPTTIFAGNGDIILSGNITTTGTGSISSANGFGGLNPSQIYSGTSNVTVTNTNVFANIAGTNTVNVSANNVAIPFQIVSNSIVSNTGTLSVGGNINYGPDYGLVASFVANNPGYAYAAIQNLNTGGNASASFTAYNNTGNSYIDVGVNSSNFNATSSGFVNNSLNTPNASYVYSYGGDMVVGTWNNNGIHFITNAVTTAGDSMFIAGNGNVYISGNLTVSGNTTFTYTTTNFVTESANVVSTAYLAGNASTNSGTITQQNTMVPSGTINLGSGSAYYSNAYATNIYGTLQTAAQPNITSVGTLTSLTVSGALSAGSFTVPTAAQPNITSVGTLSGLTVSAAIVPNANASVNLGSSGAWWATIYGTSTHAQYADLAENYQADKQYNPGTVLMFGGAAEVTIADADTTAVAGVVSTNPAHLMNGALTGQFVTPLALMGRVPCNVIGPIAKGDLLVSAGFGFAKTNNGASVGQVIGKALEDFPILAKGVIEVVVGRV